MKNLKEKRGITLIALVITIIVLIILAAVSLVALTGDNGIINRAIQAKKDTQIGTVKEIANVAYSEGLMNEYLDGTGSAIQTVFNRLTEQGYETKAITASGEVATAEVTGITVTSEGTNVAGTTVTLVENKVAKTIEVALEKIVPETDEEGNEVLYYVKIDGKWHQMDFTGEQVNIADTGVNSIEGESGEQTQQEYTVTITVPDALKNYVKVDGTAIGETGTKSITMKVGGTESANIEIDPTTAEGANLTENITGSITIEVTQISGSNKTVTVAINKPTEIIAGAFVKYEVEYTDAYYSGYNNTAEYKYSSTNGWRLLEYDYNEETDTYSNVKLISTGIPAILYYRSDGANNNWFETDTAKLTTFKDTLKNTIPTDGTYTLSAVSNYRALKASAGLYESEKFGIINFKAGTGYTDAYGNTSSNYYNKGYFTKIKNGTTYEIKRNENDENVSDNVNGEELFKASGVNAKVRLLTFPELNKIIGRTDNDSKTQISTTTEDKIGLLRLDQLKSVIGMNSYSYSGDIYWWLASPIPDVNGSDSVCRMGGNGRVAYSYDNNVGVRPIVCLESEIQLVDENGDGTLEIK